MNFQVVMPLLITDTLGGSETQFTLFFSVLSVGSFLAALVKARRTTVPIRHVVIAAAAFGVAMLALTLAPNLALAFPLGFGARAGVAVGAAAALVAAAWGWHAAGLHRRHTTNANGGRPLLQPPTVDVLGDV